MVVKVYKCGCRVLCLFVNLGKVRVAVLLKWKVAGDVGVILLDESC